MSNENDSNSFDAAVAAWREKHHLREDEAILLCIELFRIHQEHWDKDRHGTAPLSDQLHAEIVKLRESFGPVQGLINSLLEDVRSRGPIGQEYGIALSVQIIIFLAAIAAGFCLGKAFP